MLLCDTLPSLPQAALALHASLSASERAEERAQARALARNQQEAFFGGQLRVVR